MGSSQSILSPEAAVTLAVVAGALGFGYSQFGPSGATSNTPTSTEASGKKGKKKKKAAVHPSPLSEPLVPSPPAPIVVPFPKVIPGGLDVTPTPETEAALSDAPKSTKSKKKKKSKVVSSATSKQPDSTRPSQTEPEAKASGSTPSTPDNDKPSTKNKRKQTTPPSTSATSSPEAITRQLNKIQSSVSIDTDGSWTRVESRRNKSGRSVDVTTTSASEADPTTGASSPIAERMDVEADVDDADQFYTRSSNPEQRRPLAERMLPKPRKTGVESMLETADHPTLARVMRVHPRADDQPALGFSWGDYEEAHDADVDGEDDNAGWDVVKSRRPRTTRPSTSEASPSQSQSQPKKAPETLTKRQRQNAARREAQKAMKEDAEQERRATLARHQRELENERMKEQAKGRGGKKISGGMKAVVSESGKLVWE